MGARPIRAQKIARIVRMPEAQTVVQAECLDGGHRLDTPASKVRAALEVFVAQLVPIWMGIGHSLLRATGLADGRHFFVPVIDELAQLGGLLVRRRIDGLEQSRIRSLEAQLRTNLAARGAAGNDAIKQDVLAFVGNQRQQTIPEVVRDFECQCQSNEPKANHIVIEVHRPSVACVLLIFSPNFAPEAAYSIKRLAVSVETESFGMQRAAATGFARRRGKEVICLSLADQPFMAIERVPATAEARKFAPESRATTEFSLGMSTQRVHRACPKPADETSLASAPRQQGPWCMGNPARSTGQQRSTLRARDDPGNELPADAGPAN